MSDLIDRSVLKARMYSEAFESDTDMQKWDSGCWIRYKLFEKVVDNMPTVPYSTRWQRVEDGLPPKATWVLTVAKDGDALVYSIATVDAGGTWWTIAPQSLLREQNGVRYWMPIEPPKEVVNE